jgi:hypothetical protein
MREKKAHEHKTVRSTCSETRAAMVPLHGNPRPPKQHRTEKERQRKASTAKAYLHILSRKEHTTHTHTRTRRRFLLSHTYTLTTCTHTHAAHADTHTHTQTQSNGGSDRCGQTELSVKRTTSISTHPVDALRV